MAPGNRCLFDLLNLLYLVLPNISTPNLSIISIIGGEHSETQETSARKSQYRGRPCNWSTYATRNETSWFVGKTATCRRWNECTCTFTFGGAKTPCFWYWVKSISWYIECFCWLATWPRIVRGGFQTCPFFIFAFLQNLSAIILETILFYGKENGFNLPREIAGGVSSRPQTP